MNSPWMVSTTALITLITGGSLVSANTEVIQTYLSRPTSVIHAKGLSHSAKSVQFIQNAPRVSFDGRSAPIPKAYSMRGKAGPVEDQGPCGSCWDFSLTSALRGSHIMNGNDPGRLSFNYLLNCATDQGGCNGGYFNAADWLISPKGDPAYGSDGDYIAQDGTCKSAPFVSSAQSYKMLGKQGTVPSFRDIAYVVGVLHRPVSIDVAVDRNWEYYSSGVYNGCTDQNENHLNHMVTIEGYDCESGVDSQGNCKFDSNGNLKNGVGTWIIRNSWGESWGDGGYITTKATDKKGVRCNQVAHDALYFDKI